jgi:periplasmic glucans biosynthesis protein
MDRRNFLQLAGQLSAISLLMREMRISAAMAADTPQEPAPAATSAPPPSAAAAQPPEGPAPFSEDIFRRMAADLSKKPFEAPKSRIPDELKDIGYDQYRNDIRFKKSQNVWAGDNLNYNLEMFHAGFLFKNPVDIHLVENGVATEFTYSPSRFVYSPKIKAPPADSNAGYSGFRALGNIRRPDKLDEFVVFQGASYFRSFATGQDYGLSARGLAINTGQQGGEEFPFFRSFWVEKPKAGGDRLTVYALLDSPSVAGAYKFVISNANDTLMDVDMTLYPRTPIPYVGIAPLTSMFLFGPQDTGRGSHASDFRQQVYDSEALAILNGKGEYIWRPLINPQRLQFSVFVDEDPKGFGLLMRNRDFHDFQDLEARYDIRPSLWIEPLDKWGTGSVDLIELPTPYEYNDNIVAFWRPKQPLAPGREEGYRFRYRMHWCWDAPVRRTFAHFSRTRVNAMPGKPGWLRFELDVAGADKFQNPATGKFELCDDFDEICAEKSRHLQVSAARGAIANQNWRYYELELSPGKVERGYRLSFEYRTKGVEQDDLRCVLVMNGKPISETWVYRWTTPNIGAPGALH